MKRLFVILGLFLVLCSPALAADGELSARAGFINAAGENIGTATLTETPNGVLIKAEFSGLPAGTHAFHIHSVGQCEPPFKTAAGHFNPSGTAHGILSAQGPHAGDMPNIHAGESGKLTFEVLASHVTLGPGKNSLFDADGSSLVIHEGPDDYKSDPAGNAGARIACGVITR